MVTKFMQSRLITSLVTITSLAIAGGLMTKTKVTAQTSTFVCSTSQGKPATVARSAEGEIPVIIWESDYFSESGYTPEKRCQLVSERFEQYRANGMLKYLTTGVMNQQPVVCVTQTDGGSCGGLLFTLKKESDPNETLRNLLAVRDRAGGPLSETGCDTVYGNRDGKLYVDMDLYLQCVSPEAAPETEPSSPTVPSNDLW